VSSRDSSSLIQKWAPRFEMSRLPGNRRSHPVSQYHKEGIGYPPYLLNCCYCHNGLPTGHQCYCFPSLVLSHTAPRIILWPWHSYLCTLPFPYPTPWP
jgi:hypothetical protein